MSMSTTRSHSANTRSSSAKKKKRAASTARARGTSRSRKARGSRKKTGKRSALVTQGSHAMEVASGVLKKSPAATARSVKRSAQRVVRRTSPPFRSAKSMLSRIERRAGKNLVAFRRKAVRQAKGELRRLFGL